MKCRVVFSVTAHNHINAMLCNLPFYVRLSLSVIDQYSQLTQPNSRYMSKVNDMVEQQMVVLPMPDWLDAYLFEIITVRARPVLTCEYRPQCCWSRLTFFLTCLNGQPEEHGDRQLIGYSPHK